MPDAEGSRRPLKSRTSRWAQFAAQRLMATSITPNQISIASIAFALIGGGFLLLGSAPASMIICAAGIQLRLLCNLLDGMVAVEGGKKSPVGDLYNEIPDRIADSVLMICAGYFLEMPALGWCGALLAAFTAYIRALGGALRLPQDFRGPMAKPHRMAVLTGGCLFNAIENPLLGSNYSLLAALWIINIGSALTCVTRSTAIARQLRLRAAAETRP